MSLFEDEISCKTIHMKANSIDIKINLLADGTHFQIKTEVHVKAVFDVA